MISISAPIYDPAGSIRLQELPSSDTGTLRRRVSRAKTLDGGVVINDGGFAHGDRDMLVRWRPQSSAEYDAMSRMFRIYPQLTVSTRDGVFRCAPNTLETRNGETTLALLVIERME